MDDNKEDSTDDSFATDMRVCDDMLKVLGNRCCLPSLSSVFWFLVLCVVLYLPILYIGAILCSNRCNEDVMMAVAIMHAGFGIIWFTVIIGSALSPIASLSTRIKAFMVSCRAMNGDQYDKTLNDIIAEFLKI